MIFSLTGMQWALLIGLLLALVYVWKLQLSNHPFDIRDTLIDTATGKASLNACCVWIMCWMSVYVCVNPDIKDKDGLVLGVLAIFVGGRVGAQAIKAFSPPTPADPAQPRKNPLQP